MDLGSVQWATNLAGRKGGEKNRRHIIHNTEERGKDMNEGMKHNQCILLHCWHRHYNLWLLDCIGSDWPHIGLVYPHPKADSGNNHRNLLIHPLLLHLSPLLRLQSSMVGPWDYALTGQLACQLLAPLTCATVYNTTALVSAVVTTHCCTYLHAFRMQCWPALLPQWQLILLHMYAA